MANHESVLLLLSLIAEKSPALNSAILVRFLKTLSTQSLISPSFQGGPTIFHKGNFLKHTPHSKNLENLEKSKKY